MYNLGLASLGTMLFLQALTELHLLYLLTLQLLLATSWTKNRL